MSSKASTPRRGRRRIDKRAIVAAVLEIGSENVTMRRVAAHLDISLPGLYHHVKNQDDLLRLAAESALRHVAATAIRRRALGHLDAQLRVVHPDGAGLRACARWRSSSRAGCGDAMEMEYTGDAVEALAEHGLSPDDAMAVWSAVSALAVGSVTEAHREYLHAQSGQPWLARIFKLTAKRPTCDYPTLRAIAQSGFDPFSEDTFQQRMTMLLTGIADAVRPSARTRGLAAGHPPNQPVVEHLTEVIGYGLLAQAGRPVPVHCGCESCRIRAGNRCCDPRTLGSARRPGDGFHEHLGCGHPRERVERSEPPTQHLADLQEAQRVGVDDVAVVGLEGEPGAQVGIGDVTHIHHAHGQRGSAGEQCAIGELFHRAPGWPSRWRWSREGPSTRPGWMVTMSQRSCAF